MRLGIYLIHNNRYKMIKTIDVPWDSKSKAPETIVKPNGSVAGDDSFVPPMFEEIFFNCECDEDGSAPELPPPSGVLTFEDWIADYFKNEVGSDVFELLNTDRTYFILSQDDPSIMGILIVFKGRAYINFKDHDYRNIINFLHPNIREDMKIPDDNFGGFGEDDSFTFDPEKQPAADDDLSVSINKGQGTYPNFFG